MEGTEHFLKNLIKGVQKSLDKAPPQCNNICALWSLFGAIKDCCIFRILIRDFLSKYAENAVINLDLDICEL